MTLRLVSNFLAVLLLAVAPFALADVGEEATITVVDEGDTPEDVVKVIELPEKSTPSAAKSVPSDVNAAKESSKDSNKDSKGASSVSTTSGASGASAASGASGVSGAPVNSASDTGKQASNDAKDNDAKDNKELKEQAKEDAKQQGKKEPHDDNGGGKGHGPH